MSVVKLHYSERLVRQAVMAFWWRVVGWRFVIALILVAIPLILLVLGGVRSWLVGFLGAILTLSLGFMVVLYVVHYRGSVGRFRRMNRPEATLEAGDATFRVTSDAGMGEVSWKQVSHVWQFPDFWLLFLSPAQFITLPTADMNAQMRGLIVERVEAHGGRIA